MKLNIFSGRTFRNASQYPVFPWVLKNYDSDKLDLEDADSFRNLEHPIGALNPERLRELKQKYESRIADGEIPYLYSSGPMSPVVVSVFLIRMEPFTTSHINFQAGKFDVPDRMFMSVGETFSGLMSDMSEYWEVTPEFYFCPEIFENLNGFNLGVSGGRTINDVVLPKWATSALEFVYLHRKALESDVVSRSLHMWIDLVWGVGQQSAFHDNVYDWHLYRRAWKYANINTTELVAFLRLVGQIPPKLFREPHPRKGKRVLGQRQTCETPLDIANIDGIFVDKVSRKTKVFIVSRTDGLCSFS
jgi:hypothetical protein